MADVETSGNGSGNSKRRRLSDGAARLHNDDDSPPNCLADLPSGILAHTARFLAAPSRVLLLQALNDSDDDDVPSSSSAIVGSHHEVLDFGQIEKDLAEKLTDQDLQRILLHTDAVNKVKKLLLTNCIKMTGVGLEPLRGSEIIEQIDLSIVEFVGDDRETSISCDDVLPILDSIIEREGTAMKHLQFPKKWRKEVVTESDFHAFLGRYNQMWEGRGRIDCPVCKEKFPDLECHIEGPWVDTNMHSDCYATHNNVCFECLKYSCNDCDDGVSLNRFCYNCERTYCVGCAAMQYCSVCEKEYCVDYCSCFNYCDGRPHHRSSFEDLSCGATICEDCISNKKSTCRKCKKSYCSSHCSNRTFDEDEINRCDHCCSFLCYDCENPLTSSNTLAVADFFNKMMSGRHDIDKLRKCNDCNQAACADCQLKFGKSVENLDCKGCVKMIVSALLEEKEMNKELQDDIKELRGENKELKCDNRDLQGELKWKNERLERNSAQIEELKEENYRLKNGIKEVKNAIKDLPIHNCMKGDGKATFSANGGCARLIRKPRTRRVHCAESFGRKIADLFLLCLGSPSPIDNKHLDDPEERRYGRGREKGHAKCNEDEGNYSSVLRVLNECLIVEIWNPAPAAVTVNADTNNVVCLRP
eukprot:scaffold13198_cov94-Skeletonema_dohrnii-CCMP3373.AAC.4